MIRPAHPGSVFVNADEIAKVRWPGEAEARSYEAAAAAAEARTARWTHITTGALQTPATGYTSTLVALAGMPAILR